MPEVVFCKALAELGPFNNEGQCISFELKQAGLVSSLLYDARTKLVYFEFADFREQKYTAYVCFRENSPYGKIRTR